MTAFTFDGSTYEVGLNPGDTVDLADRLGQGRSLSVAAVEREAARNDDRLERLAARGPWHLMPFLESIRREERKTKVVGGLLCLVCGGVAALSAYGLFELAAGLPSQGLSIDALVDGLVMANLAAACGVAVHGIYRFLRFKPLLDRSEAARELYGRATDTVGVGDKGVYVGTVDLADGGIPTPAVRTIRFDAIGSAGDRNGFLHLQDRAGNPLLSIGVAGDGHDLGALVGLIRQRIPA